MKLMRTCVKLDNDFFFFNYLGFKCYLLPANLRGGNKHMAGGKLGVISVECMALCDVTKGSLTNSRARCFSTHLLTKGNRSKDLVNWQDRDTDNCHFWIYYYISRCIYDCILSTSYPLFPTRACKEEAGLGFPPLRLRASQLRPWVVAWR